MHTVAEIIEAVKVLPVDDKRELLRQLTPVLGTRDVLPEDAAADDTLPPDFTARLMEHFHRAKRAALRRTG